MEEFKFSQVPELVKSEPGVYEIYTKTGIPLKVGIAKDLKKRLKAHKNSKQSRLKKKDATIGFTLSNVESKQSILAKHLFFDSNITKRFDLTTEDGRTKFLEEECYLKITYTKTREQAREIEVELENSGVYRYVGRVAQR